MKLKKFLKFSVLFILYLVFFPSCGSQGHPFEMSAQATAVVGEAGLLNPEQQSAQGLVTAQLEEDFFDRSVLVIQSFDLLLEFANVGPVLLSLNPEAVSTAVIYKLNRNNQLFGTHTMNLNLLMTSAEQSLVLGEIQLSGNVATLTLNQDVPIFNFSLDSIVRQIQFLDIQVVVPTEFITSNEDPV